MSNIKVKKCIECGVIIKNGHWCSNKCQLRYKNKIAGGFYAQNNISNCPKCDG